LSGDAPEPGVCDQALRRPVIKASKERLVVALSTVAFNIMLGWAQPIAFVRIIHLR
jgi:hypothetical protein